MIGEIIGTFLGDALYGLIFEGGFGAVVKKLKEAFGAIIEKIGESLEAVKKFFSEGFKRFVDDFPTIDISKVWGLPRALGAAAGLLGLKDSKWVEDGKVNKIPNLLLLTPFGLPFMVPHLINSFFPDGKKESVSTPSKGKSDVKDKDGAKNDVEKEVLKKKNELEKSIVTKDSEITAEKDSKKKEALIKEKDALQSKITALQGESGDSSVISDTVSTSTVETKLKTANEQGGSKAVIESISTSASYDKNETKVVTVPAPKKTAVEDISGSGGGGGAPLVVSGAAEGGADPYESLYKGG